MHIPILEALRKFPNEFSTHDTRRHKGSMEGERRLVDSTVEIRRLHEPFQLEGSVRASSSSECGSFREIEPYYKLYSINNKLYEASPQKIEQYAKKALLGSMGLKALAITTLFLAVHYRSGTDPKTLKRLPMSTFQWTRLIIALITTNDMLVIGHKLHEFFFFPSFFNSSFS